MKLQLSALCCAIALAACAPQDGSSSAPAAPTGPIAGTINGEAVAESTLNAFLAGQFRKDASALTPEEIERGRESFSQMMALAQEARKLGMDGDADLQAQVAVQQMGLLARTLITKKGEDDPIDDAKVQSAYEALLNSGEAREYKARHILLETEDAAKAVITKLDEGGDFQELAKSESTGPSGPTGGDLGWFGQGRMVEPFWNATIALESGKYSAEPVQTRFGWHVILLEQTRDRPFAESEQELRSKLQREWVENYINGLQEAAEVSWNTPESTDGATQ